MVIALSQGLKPALIKGGITKMKGTGLTGFWTQSEPISSFCVVGIPIALWGFRLRCGDLIYHEHYINLIKFNRTQSGVEASLGQGRNYYNKD